MDFEQKKKVANNENNYHIENLKIVREFSKSLILEMKSLVKAIILFGSNANDTQNKNSDIDIMIVLDNVDVYVSEELRGAYHTIVNSLVNKSGGKLHIMTTNFSDYWDLLRKGDPVVTNILRTGVAIYDTGIIEPMQYLLEIGKIRPTRESVNNYMARSETLLVETEKHIQNAILDLYYSSVDIIHAVLMLQKIMPPSPKDMPQIFKKEFKGNKKISKYSKVIDEIYKIAKKVEHGKFSKFSGAEYDILREKVEDMILNLKDYIKEELKTKDLMEL